MFFSVSMIERMVVHAARASIPGKCVNMSKTNAKSSAYIGEDQVRINSGACMGRCNEGPVIVVYPEAVCYTFVDEEDLDEIIE